MRLSRKDVAILVTSSVAASTLALLAHWLVARFVIHDVTYRIAGGWLYWPFLFGWVVDAILFGATGVILAIVLDASRQELWALFVGALYSLAVLLIGALHSLALFASALPLRGDASTAVYVWVYGAYLVPPLSCWLAAAYSKHHAEHRVRYPA
jgi:hypothetical protein